MGAEIPVQRTSPAPLHTTVQSLSASPIPVVPQSEPQITCAQPWVVLFLSTVCKRLHSHPSLLPGGSMGCGQCQQQGAPRAARPTWGCFPLWLHEREAEMWSLAHKRCVCSLILSHLPVPPHVPCQSLHPPHSVTAICHSDWQAECGITATLVAPGSVSAVQASNLGPNVGKIWRV